HPDETRAQVQQVLERHPALRTLDTPAVLAGIAREPLGLPDAPSAQLWPHRHGTDAMFVQLLTTLEVGALETRRTAPCASSPASCRRTSPTCSATSNASRRPTACTSTSWTTTSCRT